MKLYYEQENHVRKFLVICATQLAGGILLKMLKYLEVMFYKFEYLNKTVLFESLLQKIIEKPKKENLKMIKHSLPNLLKESPKTNMHIVEQESVT